MYQKMGVVEISRDEGNHLENNSFMKIHSRAKEILFIGSMAGPNKNT